MAFQLLHCPLSLLGFVLLCPLRPPRSSHGKAVHLCVCVQKQEHQSTTSHVKRENEMCIDRHPQKNTAMLALALARACTQLAIAELAFHGNPLPFPFFLAFSPAMCVVFSLLGIDGDRQTDRDMCVLCVVGENQTRRKERGKGCVLLLCFGTPRPLQTVCSCCCWPAAGGG